MSSRWIAFRAPSLLALSVIGLLLAGGSRSERAPGPPGERVATEDGFCLADPHYSWSFPADHWAHPCYRNEWWYFTGQLISDDGRRFGYQFTLFRIGIAPDSMGTRRSQWQSSALVMGHASLSELSTGRHRFSELLYRASPLLGGFPPPPSPVLAWARAPAGTDTTWQVSWNGTGFDFEMADRAQGFSFHLSTRPERPLVFQGPNGFSPKGRDASAASQYYSFTRLQTEGVLRLDGTDLAVRGRSWMDKEFGSNQLTAGQAGWDWWSLQLDDGRDLMLYRLRRADGSTDYARGTIIDAEGARYLDVSGWDSRPTSSWRSLRTKTDYPARWIIEVPAESLRLEVVPELPDQENVSPGSGGIHYWEGAVRVLDPSGRRIGQGYVELTGYGRGSRPPI